MNTSIGYISFSHDNKKTLANFVYFFIKAHNGSINFNTNNSSKNELIKLISNNKIILQYSYMGNTPIYEYNKLFNLLEYYDEISEDYEYEQLIQSVKIGIKDYAFYNHNKLVETYIKATPKLTGNSEFEVYKYYQKGSYIDLPTIDLPKSNYLIDPKDEFFD